MVNSTRKKIMENSLLDIILEHASTHPHRDLTIGIKGYDNVSMEQRREENINHWKLLVQKIEEYLKEVGVGEYSL
jgi:hypothetical protein